MVKFDSGKGTEAAGHDDLVFALMLSADMQERSIGRAALPAAFREVTAPRPSPTSTLAGATFLAGSTFPLAAPRAPRALAEIDTATVKRYIEKRQADKMVVQKARTIRRRGNRTEVIPEITRSPSPAEINRELQVLKRCFNLAVEEGRLLHTPHVPMLQEDNVRQGFLDLDQLQEVLALLPTELRPVIQFAYLTGWRIASEVLPLEWSRVDFTAGEVRLSPESTKSRISRTHPA